MFLALLFFGFRVEERRLVISIREERWLVNPTAPCLSRGLPKGQEFSLTKGMTEVPSLPVYNVVRETRRIFGERKSPRDAAFRTVRASVLVYFKSRLDRCFLPVRHAFDAISVLEYVTRRSAAQVSSRDRSQWLGVASRSKVRAHSKLTKFSMNWSES